MIQLYQFPPMFGLPNISPFCLKVETWLLMSGVAYESVYTGDTSLAPKAKLPFIRDGKTDIADSRLIPAYLKGRGETDPDTHLDSAQQAIAHAFTRMLDEQLLWTLIYTRFMIPEITETLKNSLLGALPEEQREAAFGPMKARVVLMLEHQGIARLSEQEVMQLAIEDLTAISQQLANQPFLLGQQPCSADASAFGFLANFIWGPLGGPLGEHARGMPTLVKYCERMLARYFPSYDIPA